MKGNQEPMLYTTNAAVASLNHVPGFDPLKFLRRTTSRKTREDVMRLDLRYKKLWFRLACPTGRLNLNALRITEKMAIFEAKVYRDREDAEPLSSYVANCTLDATPGGLYVEAAQEEALDTALSNAGFGIQFADVSSESEEYGSEVPVGAKVRLIPPAVIGLTLFFCRTLIPPFRPAVSGLPASAVPSCVTPGIQVLFDLFSPVFDLHCIHEFICIIPYNCDTGIFCSGIDLDPITGKPGKLSCIDIF